LISREKREHITLLFVVFIIFYLLLAYRLYNIQVIQQDKFKEIAQQEHLISLSIDGERGNIYDRNLNKMALNVSSKSLFAIPFKIVNPHDTAKNISSILGLDTSDVYNKLTQKKSFVWIKRKCEDEEVLEIEKLNLEGLHFLRENKRYYPNNYLASNIIGFVGIDNQGLEGLELVFDDILKSRSGLAILERDASGKKIPLSIKELNESKNGESIVLTIDKVIQYITEEALEKGFLKAKANAGIAIVVEPKTGEILSMAVRPTFNPNKYFDFKQNLWRNRAITDVYEPGSTFKIVTISSALEENVAKLDDRFNCKGWIKYNGHIFHDIHIHHEQDLTDIIKNSCNIGLIQVGTRMNEAVFEKYIRSFGFGALTGIELPGEIGGLVRKATEWSKISLASLSIGQEISVTPLQLIMAVSSIANQGTLMKPIIVREILDSNFNKIKAFKPKPIRQVVSRDTASKVSKALEQVVIDGTGTMAMIPGYRIAGKTGTAQKFDLSLGKYSDDKFNSLFVGYVPADDPKMVILVLIDEPKGSYYGGTVAAPVFKEIASKALSYLSVPPNNLSE